MPCSRRCATARQRKASARCASRCTRRAGAILTCSTKWLIGSNIARTPTRATRGACILLMTIRIVSWMRWNMWTILFVPWNLRRDVNHIIGCSTPLDLYRPKVFEMSRLNVSHVVLSKSKLTKLVDTGKVRGWDDPRMPTISGLRRRGYSPAAVNAFCRDVGVTRNENFIEYSRLQHFARQDLEEESRIGGWPSASR